MVLNRLRAVSEKIMKPMANFAIKIGITPNVATLLGFAVAVLAAGLIFLYPMWNYILVISAILLFLAGYFDALDGAIARNSHTITAFGGFLDSVLDRYSDAILIGCIILVGYPYSVLCVPWIGLIAMVGSLLVSYTRARAESVSAEKMAVGFAERAERTLILIGVLILQGNPFLRYTTSPLYNYTSIGMIVLAIITHITVIHRILHARKVLPETTQQSNENAIEITPEENVNEILSSPEAIPTRSEKAIT
jgi:archaetidylinositol phosphate synthase